MVCILLSGEGVLHQIVRVTTVTHFSTYRFRLSFTAVTCRMYSPGAEMNASEITAL